MGKKGFVNGPEVIGVGVLVFALAGIAAVDVGAVDVDNVPTTGIDEDGTVGSAVPFVTAAFTVVEVDGET